MFFLLTVFIIYDMLIACLYFGILIINMVSMIYDMSVVYIYGTFFDVHGLSDFCTFIV